MSFTDLAARAVVVEKENDGTKLLKFWGFKTRTRIQRNILRERVKQLVDQVVHEYGHLLLCQDAVPELSKDRERMPRYKNFPVVLVHNIVI